MYLVNLFLEMHLMNQIAVLGSIMWFTFMAGVEVHQFIRRRRGLRSRSRMQRWVRMEQDAE